MLKYRGKKEGRRKEVRKEGRNGRREGRIREGGRGKGGSKEPLEILPLSLELKTKSWGLKLFM